MGNAMLTLWCRELDLPLQREGAKQFFFHTLEHFYLQATPASISKNWLSQYFKDLGLLAQSLRQA
jgi:hypothetical protein